MNTILKYLIIQIQNYWKTLRFRTKLEITLLFIVFYTVFTNKLTDLFTAALQLPDATPAGLAALIIHVFLFIALVTTPFIYFNLLPKQKGLTALRLQPMSLADSLTTLVSYFLKYQIILVLIMIPVFSAVAITCGFILFFYSIFIFATLLILALFLVHVLTARMISKTIIILIYISICTLYYLLFTIFYWIIALYIYFDLFLVIFASFLIYRYWKKHGDGWDAVLYKFGIPIQDIQPRLKINYHNFPAIVPKRIRPIFVKDILAYIRNRHYLKIKLISLLLYIALIILIEIQYTQYFIQTISVLTFLIIWEHYSHQFNEKYVMQESEIFLKTQPLTYYQYSLASIYSEFLFILPILIVFTISSFIHGLDWSTILTMASLIVLFSIFVLYVITLIRVIFFDNPRFAGYAYHFLIIFALVMNLNFFLVGPIITIATIIYLQYLSYHHFVK
jgi:hypothetical protein